MQQLQKKSGSGVVTIPKPELRKDNLVEEDGSLPDSQTTCVDRLGRRTYVIRFPEGGDLPDLHECEHIRRIAADLMMKNQRTLEQPAD